MHGKFLKYGSGSAHRANEYILGNKDHKGDLRHQVLLIQGNPEMFSAVADSLDFKSRYKSYVAGFAKEDDPTIEEINEFVDEFKKTAFAGLEPDEYVFYAALHVDEDGKKDLHILSANVHLKTGKALNIAPPNWQKSFDPLRDWFNNTKGWARPDDPARARTFQRGVWNLSDKETPKDQIHNYLMQCFNHGLINDRNDVINLMSEIGTITRQGDDYISIKIEGEKKSFRFKGELYGKQFSSDRWVELAGKSGSETEIIKRNTSGRELITSEHRERAAAAGIVLESTRESRAAYNKNRYKKNNQENIENILDNNNRVINLSNSNCIFIHDDEPRHNINSSESGANGNVGWENLQNIQIQQQNDPLQNKRNDRIVSGEINDRTRNDAITELKKINLRIRNTGSKLAESISGLEASKRGIDGAFREAANAVRLLMQTARGYLEATHSIVSKVIEHRSTTQITPAEQEQPQQEVQTEAELKKFTL